MAAPERLTLDALDDYGCVTIYFYNLTRLNGKEIVARLEKKVREDIGYISQ